MSSFVAEKKEMQKLVTLELVCGKWTAHDQKNDEKSRTILRATTLRFECKIEKYRMLDSNRSMALYNFLHTDMTDDRHLTPET